jgi:hypothetical protein
MRGWTASRRNQLGRRGQLATPDGRCAAATQPAWVAPAVQRWGPEKSRRRTWRRRGAGTGIDVGLLGCMSVCVVGWGRGCSGRIARWTADVLELGLGPWAGRSAAQANRARQRGLEARKTIRPRGTYCPELGQIRPTISSLTALPKTYHHRRSRCPTLSFLVPVVSVVTRCNINEHHRIKR